MIIRFGTGKGRTYQFASLRELLELECVGGLCSFILEGDFNVRSRVCELAWE